MLALARLLRLPNVFTAISNVAMGFLFVRGGIDDGLLFSALIASSACMYMAGMVLNDLFDFDVDKVARPNRPLPSGAISLRSAAAIGWGLLLLGCLCACLASAMNTSLGWRPAILASALAGCIVLYDGPLKRTVVAPTLMGACRTLNVLLGMSALASPTEHAVWLGFDGSHLMVAIAIGVFVMGVTWFARREAEGRAGGHLVAGLALMVIGLILLASFHHFGDFGAGTRTLTFPVAVTWPLAVLLLGFSTIRRCLFALSNPNPRVIGLAIRHCILSLIVFDAGVTLAVCPGWAWSVAVLALLIPFLVLGRWIEST